LVRLALRKETSFKKW